MIRFRRDRGWQQALSKVIKEACAGSCKPSAVHMSIVDLNGSGPCRYAGHRDKSFVYPASIYKLFVAMAVFQEAKAKRLSLTRHVRVSTNNAVDKKKEIPGDPRPLLRPGDWVTIGHLVSLMITRSDNTAANVLIDLVTRERINRMIRRYGWLGSEVTRKFLGRDKEDEKYREAKPTVTTTRHLAEFFFRLDKQELVDSQSSLDLEHILAGQLDGSKIRAGLSKEAHFFNKTGWFSYKNQKQELVGVTGDCGIVDWMIAPDSSFRFAVACIVVLPDNEGNAVLKRIGERLESLLWYGYPS